MGPVLSIRQNAGTGGRSGSPQRTALRLPGRVLSGLGALVLVVSGCSGASVPYIFTAVETDYTLSRCQKLRSNMMATTDPVEMRYWELLVEEHKCPAPQDIIENAP